MAMANITIVGVGFAGGQLTEAVQAALTGGARVLLHTDRCPCAEWLRARGIPYESLDDLYESLEDFDVQRFIEIVQRFIRNRWTISMNRWRTSTSTQRRRPRGCWRRRSRETWSMACSTCATAASVICQ